MATETITKDSKPVFCYFSKSGECWSCNDLIVWHKALNDAYGLDSANNTFLTAWNDSPFINAQIDCRSSDAEFIKYMKAAGLHDALFSGIGIIAKPISTTTQIINSSTNVADSFFKYLPYIIGTIVLLIVLAIGLQIFKATKKISA